MPCLIYCEDLDYLRTRGGYLPCRAVPLDNRLLIQFWSLNASVLVPRVEGSVHLWECDSCVVK